MATSGQLPLFAPRRDKPIALLTWKTLCDHEPAYWEWMECVGGYMPRDAEGYALVDSRRINPPKLSNTIYGRRWDSF